MPFALLHFLFVMSRSLFSVSLPVAPAAGYGCPLPYLKSFFSYLPCQPVVARHDLLPFALPGSYRKILWTVRSFASVWERSLYPLLRSFPGLPVLPSGFSPRSVYGLLPASCHICSYSFPHPARFARIIRLISALISLVSSAMIWRLIFL